MQVALATHLDTQIVNLGTALQLVPSINYRLRD